LIAFFYGLGYIASSPETFRKDCMIYTLLRREPVADDHLKSVANPLIRQLYARRKMPAEVYPLQLKHLIQPQKMKSIQAAARLIADAVQAQKKIMIAGDFDADGATSTAIMMLALRRLGCNHLDFLVPHRIKMGYGLTPALVDLAHEKGAELVVTVDNGISSFAGVAHARSLGMAVVITDHHLVGQGLPDADAIVNPNQPECEFSSKAIAGCGVAFYVMCMVRQDMLQRGMIDATQVAPFTDLLDLVALGTVADVVPLDANNRIMVQAGLMRMRQGQCRPGIQALVQVAKKDISQIEATDLGFALGPRLNAAGRLDDMRVGVELLLCESSLDAYGLAMQLDHFNRSRRSIEQAMKEQAEDLLQALHIEQEQLPWGLALFDARWHQGVVGIVASRIKEQHHRPVIAFALSEDGLIKGSARSIPGVHIRDVLSEMQTEVPGLMLSFGGHAMAAGVSMAREQLSVFQSLFQAVLQRHMSPEDLQGALCSDGALEPEQITLATAQQLAQAGPWGQGFPEPLFDNEFLVVQQKWLGEQHLKLVLMLPDGQQTYEAIWFFAAAHPCSFDLRHKIHVAYKLQVNQFRNQTKLQLQVQQATPL
jgi:single-stranded-DNA-specific exonuclease